MAFDSTSAAVAASAPVSPSSAGTGLGSGGDAAQPPPSDPEAPRLAAWRRDCVRVAMQAAQETVIAAIRDLSIPRPPLSTW